MMSKNTRSYQPEWIDLGPAYYSLDEYQDCLYQLDRIGRLLGGDRATWSAFKRLPFSPQSIIDVGCGGGFFTLKLGKRYPQAQIIGTDLSTEAIAFAKNHPRLPNVKFIIPSCPELDFPPKSVDIVTSTLVCHHLTDEQLIDFLKRACRVAKKAVIFNDLHRHFLATASFGMITPFVFRNRLIFHDGLLSIQRAFTKKDWMTLLQAAEIPSSCYSVTWHWAFRWIVSIDTTHLGHSHGC
jgi:2-polyprenyl-3-methyl-5-hydroxy-6-metoxy-1,4-benzoquinol methylase